MRRIIQFEDLIKAVILFAMAALLVLAVQSICNTDTDAEVRAWLDKSLSTCTIKDLLITMALLCLVVNLFGD